MTTVKNSLNGISAETKRSQLLMAAAYAAAILLGAACGFWGGETLHAFADFISTVFVRLFKFISVPIIAVSIIATLANFSQSRETGRIFRHTIFYTLFTTVLAAGLAALLYVFFSPANVTAVDAQNVAAKVTQHSYLEYVKTIVPDNLIAPFL